MSRTTSVKKLFGYGIGDFGLNIYWNTLSLTLIYWYTNVVGIPPIIGGMIYLLGLVWDAVTDPVVASLAQRHRSRFGTYRPLIFAGSFILAICFSVLFWTPPFEGPALIITLCLVHMLFRTAYTLVSVPYSALSSRITFRSEERTELVGVRMFCALTGLLAVSALWFPIVRFFGDGDDLSPQGFHATATVAGVFATIFLCLCVFATKEQAPPGVSLTKRPSLAGFGRVFMRNKALRILLLSVVLQSSSTTIYVVSLTFFAAVNEATFAAKEVVLIANAVVSMAAVVVWTFLIKRFGKKICWLFASGIIAITGLHLAVFGPVVIAGIPLQVLCFAAGYGGFAVFVWSMIPDMVEYDHWKYGERNEGAVFGMFLLAQKFAGGVMGAMFGVTLTLIGFEAGADVQSARTIDGIQIYLGLGPAVLLILSSLTIVRSPMNRHLHARIVSDLRKRETEGSGQGNC